MSAAPRVLVFGAAGMLGRVVAGAFRASGFATTAVARALPSGAPFDARRDADVEAALAPGFDYAVNCAAILTSAALERDDAAREAAILVNARFPLVLARLAGAGGTRVLHVSTDGVFSGRATEPYVETDPPDATDVYGRTKALGESTAPNVLNVRTSIVGVDRENGRGLVEWFLRSPEGQELTGFEDQRWNGVTTMQLASALAETIRSGAFDALRTRSHLHHYCPNPTCSKYELLVALNRISGDLRTVRRGVSRSGTLGRVLGSSDGALNDLAPARGEWDAILSDLLSTR